MDIFSYMDNIWFDDVQEFMKNVDRHRAGMLSADENLLYSKEFVIDIDNIKELRDGRLCSLYKGYQFKSFFHRKESKYLYVILNGALTGKKPQFGRWSYYSFLDGSVLDIADPMYEKYEKLKLGWYYGSSEENLRLYCADYVKSIADYLHIKYENIVFMGSSGGGAAVLECANYIDGAVAVSINPQVLLCDYSYAHEFENITQIRLSMDNWHRADGIYQLKQGKHILLMNLRSEFDMEQMKKICDAMAIRIKYGINVFPNLIIWLYDCDLGNYRSAHTLQENYCICFFIEWLVHHFNNKRELQNADSLFRLVNEFWSYRYRLELEWRNQKINFAQIKDCIKNTKKMAVWGSGKIAKKVLMGILDVENSNYLNIGFVIDSNELLRGQDCCGLRIITPDLVEDWKSLFIIVAVENGKSEIIDFLENKGFLYKSDYILYYDLCSSIQLL